MDQAGNVFIPTGLALGTFVSATNTSNGAIIPASAFTINGGTITIAIPSLRPYLRPTSTAATPDTFTIVTNGATITFNAYIGSVHINNFRAVANAVVNPVTPLAPAVTADDVNNTVAGMTVGMEYNIDGVGYVAYDAVTFNAINFAGVHSLLVRVAAAGINPAGAVTTLSFTTNPDTTLPLVNSLTVTGNIGAAAGYTNTRTVAIATSGSDNIGVTGWYVSDSSSSIPLVAPAANLVTGAQPTTYDITNAGDGIKTIYVWARDAQGNVSLARTMNITLDTGAVSIPVTANWGTGWGTGVASGSTTASTFTTANTNNGAIQSLTVTANNGATVSLPSGFTYFGNAVPISLVAPVNNTGANITVTLTFTTTNLAGTVNITTQNLIVSPSTLIAPTNVVVNGTVVSWTAITGGIPVAGYTVDNITTGTVDLCGGSTATTCDVAGKATAGDTLGVSGWDGLRNQGAITTIVVPAVAPPSAPGAGLTNDGSSYAVG